MLTVAGLGTLGVGIHLAEAYEGRAAQTGTLITAGTVLMALGCLRIIRATLPGGTAIEAQPDDTTVYAQPAAPDQEPREVRDEREVETAARYYVADRALERLLEPEEPPLVGARIHVHVYDQTARALVSILDDVPDAVAWAPGVGAVGTAWADRAYVIATGASVADETFGLSPEMQERYRNLQAVAAVPVLNASDVPIAVLSASTHDVGVGERLASPDGEAALVALAWGVARIMVDLLNWFDDDAEASER